MAALKPESQTPSPTETSQNIPNNPVPGKDRRGKKSSLWPFGSKAGNSVVKFKRPAVPEALFMEKLDAQPVTKNELDDSDIIIVLMGPTGSGKSTFLETVAGKEGAGWAGESLKSFTTDIQAVRITAGDFRVVLVDTPGFDDTTRSDLEILELISKWLKDTYERGLYLSGILYLHRISDNRMGGTPLKNLEMFKKVCGEDLYEKVILVTTMWEFVDQETGGEREHELKKVYWAELLRRGSQTLRFEKCKEARAEAWGIVNCVVTMDFGKQAIQIQEELVELKKSLPNTKAGRELHGLIEQLIEQQRAVLQKLRDEVSRTSDPMVMKELLNELTQLNVRREEAINQMRQLHPWLWILFWRKKNYK